MRGGARVEITIKGEAKEIAALVVAIQGRRCRDMSQDEFETMLQTSLSEAIPGVILPEE